MVKKYCKKCEFWLYDKSDIGNTLEIHQEYGCNNFIERLKGTKSVLENVYGNNWKNHWPGKIPSYL